MSLLSDLKELLLPRLCPVCGHLLVEGEDVLCTFCAIGLPRYRITSTEDNRLLRMLWSIAEVQRAWTFMAYNQYSPYHRLIIDMKFHGYGDMAVRMGRWAAQEAARQDFWLGVDALVPVPLTWRRRLHRGYNQAELLARGMAEATGLPVVRLLRRTASRTPQSHLSREERLRNAQGIYRASIPDAWRGRHFVLVDDVMTTGSTIGICARAILEADPQAQVSVLPLSFAGV